MAEESVIAPYAEAHRPENLHGPGDGRPTAMQIIEDEGLVNKWGDMTVLITGGSSGLGIETARALHATGARVFLTTRGMTKADAVAHDILAKSPSKVPLEVIFMELDSLASVKAGAEAFLKRSSTLNILINNAGIMASPHDHTQDGFERQFGVNHLSHFLLTKLLLPTLIEASTQHFASRIVNLSSSGHHHSPGGLTPEALADLDFQQTPYSEWVAYGRSKTANILHANQLERLYGSSPSNSVHAFSLHPGGVATALWRHQDAGTVARRVRDYAAQWKSPEQGAATTVWCAVAAVWEGRSGRYCENVQECLPDREGAQMGDPGYAPWARDETAEKRLWEMSEEMVQPWMD